MSGADTGVEVLSGAAVEVTDAVLVLKIAVLIKIPFY